jgi:hypothetical protein
MVSRRPGGVRMASRQPLAALNALAARLNAAAKAVDAKEVESLPAA